MSNPHDSLALMALEMHCNLRIGGALGSCQGYDLRWPLHLI